MAITLTEDQISAIALYALITGLEPDRREKIERCDCEHCKAALVMLDIAESRMRDIIDAKEARKN